MTRKLYNPSVFLLVSIIIYGHFKTTSHMEVFFQCTSLSLSLSFSSSSSSLVDNSITTPTLASRQRQLSSEL